MQKVPAFAALSLALLCAGCGGNTTLSPSSNGSRAIHAVRSNFPHAPIMLKIATCESGMRQYDEHGRVVHGRVHRPDSGLFQINAAVHRAKARAMGYDIDTTEGNVAYAKYLYETRGTIPWRSSRHCWHRR